jgi:N-acetylmuramoyl-L-alanine amidase
MLKRILAVIVAAVVAAGYASAAAPAKALYAEALAREQAVRAALGGDQPAAATLNDVREVVAAYEAIVRRYPASGYSDNALWQAGRLALDAFARFGQPHDRSAGIRLLRALETQYPTSKLAKNVGAELARPLAGPALRAEQAPPLRASLATIKNITRATLPDAVRVTIELDAEVPFHEERLADPARVFIDLPSTRAAPALVDQTLRFDGDADMVRQIRLGRHPNRTTRVVLDAIGVSSYSVYALYDPYRLVIDCARSATGTTGPLASSVPPARRRDTAPPLLNARTVNVDWGRRLPSIAPRAADWLASARAVPSTPMPPAPLLHAEVLSTPVSTAPPAKNLAGGLSIARQLGLSVSRIVIDPGHGGHDPGAKGKGVSEAELVLDVALRLEALLQKTPGVEVILTRRTDEFISLQERTAIANREGADLFLSIHANASANAQARGIETYFLNFANNLSAAAVAARENAASGQAMGALPDFVKAIALNNKLDESRDFATQVQRAMIERVRGPNRTVRDLGVKQAPFVVLIGAAMPSVLAEISFVTNQQEARLLRAPSYRQRIAEALLAAIRKYQTSLKRVTAVAHQ